jgi:hypothetical protein
MHPQLLWPDGSAKDRTRQVFGMSGGVSREADERWKWRTAFASVHFVNAASYFRAASAEMAADFEYS